MTTQNLLFMGKSALAAVVAIFPCGITGFLAALLSLNILIEYRSATRVLSHTIGNAKFLPCDIRSEMEGQITSVGLGNSM